MGCTRIAKTQPDEVRTRTFCVRILKIVFRKLE